MIHDDDGSDGLPPWMHGGVFLPNIMGPIRNPEIQITRHAEQVINASPKVQVDGNIAECLAKNIDVANLWLTEASSLTATKVPCQILTRSEWVKKTAQGWWDLTSPISSVIASKLIQQAQQNLPESFKPLVSQLSQAMQQVGKASLLVQIGNATGTLALEVLSGCDIGIPLIDPPVALLLPENVVKFANDFHLALDEAVIYLACREIAYTSLVQNCSWIRSGIFSAIHGLSKSMSVDHELTDINDLHLDAPNALAQITGTVKFEPNEQQMNALRALEDHLAIIEGWVGVITARATERLPRAAAINETILRRRLEGSPAEKALSALMGIDLHPHRLRASLDMWNKVTENLGPDKRDELWAHPDIVPTSHDMDNPDELLKRLIENKSDQFDTELMKLIDSELSKSEEVAKGAAESKVGAGTVGAGTVGKDDANAQGDVIKSDMDSDGGVAKPDIDPVDGESKDNPKK